jgi:hypothetical protein
MQGDHVVIADWPMQFLRAGTPLLQEALATAIEKDVEGTQVRVLTSEHIAAVALETDRAKDKTRVLQFIEAGTLDVGRLKGILGRHGLSGHLGAIRATIPQITSETARLQHSKRKFRQKLANAPIAEKLRMLDALRQRALAIRRGSESSLTAKSSVQETSRK